MNKAELIEALAPRLGGRAQAAEAVEAMVDVVLREVSAGRSVGITGFGTFEKVDRAPRTGRNPRTGEPIPIPGTSAPRFRAGAYFKEAVADPSTLPAQGLAGARVRTHESTGESTGAPRSVRKAAGHDAAASFSGRRRGAGSDAPAASRRPARGTSGTPETVKRTPEDAAQETSQPAEAAVPPGKARQAVPTGGGDKVLSGSEEITRDMIASKKAQLARVKNDAVAKDTKKSKDEQKAAKKAEKKAKDKKKAKKDDAKKGKKSKK